MTGMRMASSREWSRRAVTDIGLRVRRGRLDRLILGAAIVVALAEVTTLVIALVLLFGEKPPALGTLGSTNPVVADASAWMRALIYFGLGLLTALAVLTTVRFKRTGGGPLEGVRAALVLVAVLASSSLAILGAYARHDHVVVIVGVCASVIGAALVIATKTRSRGTVLESVVFAVGVLLSGSSWWLLAATTNGEVAPANPVNPSDPVWVTVTMIVLEVAGVLAFYGLSTAGKDRVAIVRSRVHRARSLTSVSVIAAVVLVFLTLRLTVLSTMLDDNRETGDAALWTLRSPESWPHALLVAALIVWIANRSQRVPLIERGFRPIVAILTGAFAYASVLSIALGVSYLLTAAYGLPLMDQSVFLSCGPVDCLQGIRVIAVLSLVVFLFLPTYRRTVAFAVALVGVLFLLPGSVAPIIVTAWPDVPTFWSTPSEVVLCIVLLCAGILIARWFGLSQTIPLEVVMRLLIYPLIVIHAVNLVPAVLGAGFGNIVSMALVILSLLLLLPPVASSRSRQTRVLATAAGLALFAAVALVTPAESEAWSRTSQITALLYLAVPVATGLLIRSSDARAQEATEVAAGSRRR